MNHFKSPQLKIKHVSLGLEAALIHREEVRIKKRIQRVKDKLAVLKAAPSRDITTIVTYEGYLAQLRADRDSLREHRKEVVRTCARDALLAYGFLRGRSYLQMERKRYDNPDFDMIEAMICRHGSRAGSITDLKQQFERWKQEAGEPAKREG